MQRDEEMNAPDINRHERNVQQENNNNEINETENNQGNRHKSTRTPTLNWTQQTIPQYDTTPNRQNEAWGSNINNLPSTIFRVYFQNVNGLQFKTNNSRWQPHLQYMKDNRITISGFAETNMNWYSKHIKRQISAETQAVFDNYSIACSDNRFNPPDRSPYLLGGCLQWCTDHWTSRMIRTIQDPRKMGRWTGQQFRLKDGKTLSVITAYRPCQQSISDENKQTTTVTFQQKLLFTKDQWKDIDIRQTFITDMIKEIQKIEEDLNNMCILMMDANESIEDSSGAIRKI
jgi:hypothetical protein